MIWVLLSLILIPPQAPRPPQAPPVRIEKPIDPWRSPNVEEFRRQGLPFHVPGWHRPEPGETLIRGNHWHYCPDCDLIQQHASDNFGDAAAHRCPECGRLIWDKSAGAAAKPQLRTFQPTFFRQDCPT